MDLALFDLDNTLLKGDSDDLWSRYLMHIGILDVEVHKYQSEAFYQSYLDGSLNIATWLEYQLEPLTRYSMETLCQWREDFIQEWIVPLMLPIGFKTIAEHKAKGDDIVIVTATNDFITEPIARRFGIKHLIASQAEKDASGHYTGRCYGTPSFREGKVKRLEEWLASQGKKRTDYQRSWFYSDSHNDIPLLSIVDSPVAVNPDATLLKYAQTAQWKIMDFRMG
jgi:HAD superfamily hydrolase (TIGR01490 family)